MGKHARSLVAAVLVVLGGFTVAGTAQADDPMAHGTPCTEDARACVDLAAKHAWLIDGGRVVRGPVPVSVGAAGRETPKGDFRVEWKNTNHRSSEREGARMPFAVFFAEGGIAFHEGALDRPSAGCVRLGHADAIEFYDFLDVGDPVQVR
jgi:lipoprotein-anchoring transpeptidase ErfK/SrfK